MKWGRRLFLKKSALFAVAAPAIIRASRAQVLQFSGSSPARQNLPRPDATNTGYSNAPGYPGSLTTGPTTITSGTTYSFMEFLDGIFMGTVDNPLSNVTFHGCRFAAVGDVNIALFGDNFTFSYCTIEPKNSPTKPVAYNAGYQYGIEADGGWYSFVEQLTLDHCDIWGFGNAIDINGSTQAKPQVFTNNWIHDPRLDGGIDHTDGLGTITPDGGASSYVIIDNNVIEGVGNTNALAFQGGTYDHYMITNNVFGGYGFTLSMYTSSTNLTFTDNTYSTMYAPTYGPMREDWTGYAGFVWRRNKWSVPSGAGWGNPAHDGWFWMPVSGASSDDTRFVSQVDYQN